MTTTGILDIDMDEVRALQKELRAVSSDFATAVQNELRAPVLRAASDFKFAARGQLGRYGADAASTIRGTSSNKSGYSIKRENNSRFTQDAYVNRTGNVRHPLFGNRKYWFDTPVAGAKGWWDDMYKQAVPRATEEFTEALLKVLDRLQSKDLSTTSAVSGSSGRVGLRL